MAAVPAAPDADTAAIAELHQRFSAHRQAFLRHPFPQARERRAHLYALAQMLLDNRQRLREALRADFTVHPDATADLVDIGGPLSRALSAARHVGRWMRPERRPVERLSFGSSRACVSWQPKGVAGIVVPWNFPFDLSLGPLADMLAAGNRVIIKMSEYTPACGRLAHEIIARTFAADHVTVVNGGVELARAFTALRWDHLLFTGNPEVGRQVALTAAGNLVPVTLELGGKNPAVFAPDAVTAEHVGLALGVKLVNGGQMCVSMDHCLVPAAQLERFIALARAHFERTLRDYSRTPHCTGIISPRHFERQLELMEEARRAGARIIQLDTGGAVDAATRRLPVSLVIDPDPRLRLMQEEIFGPLLPVISYHSMEQVIERLKREERPLALYLYTGDAALIERFRRETVSGGFGVNAIAAQAALDDLGFGGAGRSGAGRYHGYDGFREFSNPRGMFVRGRGGGFKTFLPPYGRGKQRQIDRLFALRRLQLRLARMFYRG
ncbi:MAG TPA: aldehyde dehydrogenase family protein [Steroidobacteraceae bacterium]|nr:aldehyde dehydrogenase family protein [Steroidobacteraceae bacterium]